MSRIPVTFCPYLVCAFVSTVLARSTVFWRNQKGKSAEHLATIEAIYYFMVDYHTHVLGSCSNPPDPPPRPGVWGAVR